MNPRVSNTCIRFAKNYEGLGPRDKSGAHTNARIVNGEKRWFPYHGAADPPGVWTVGYGHVCTPAEKKKYDLHGVNEKEAEALLREDFRDVEGRVNAALPGAQQHEFDALCLIAMNNGPGILERGHSLGDALATRDRKKICAAFTYYICSGKPLKPRQGLAIRRLGEAYWFYTGKLPAATVELAGQHANELILADCLPPEDRLADRCLQVLGK